MHELKVLPRDLQLCTDMATGVDSLGQFQFGDMVQLDAQTVGVIVQIQKENFQVWYFIQLFLTFIINLAFALSSLEGKLAKLKLTIYS